MGDSNPTWSSASSPEGILTRGEGAHPPGGSAPVAPASTTRLYDRTYAGFELDARQQVRLETYGEDFGQNSWLTPDVRRQELVGDEGEETFEGVQRFLTVTCTLASERRLARYTFLARRQ